MVHLKFLKFLLYVETSNEVIFLGRSEYVLGAFHELVVPYQPWNVERH